MNASIKRIILGHQEVQLKGQEQIGAFAPLNYDFYSGGQFQSLGYNQALGQEKLQVALLAFGDIPEMLALQEYIYNMLPVKSLLVKDSRKDLEEALSTGFAIGFLNKEERIVGYRVVSIPKADGAYHLGKYLNLGGDALKRSAHLETTIVLPSYRGNQLQYKSLVIAEKRLKDQGITDLLCTVSPFNAFSLKNVMQAGLKIKALRRMYGDRMDNTRGLWRFVMHKEADKELELDVLDQRLVGIDALADHSEMLARGYIGAALSANKKSVLYVHQ